MNMPPMANPLFYLFAVPEVLLPGNSKSGFGAGFGSPAVPMMGLGPFLRHRLRQARRAAGPALPGGTLACG